MVVQGLTLVIEQLLDLGGHRGHDGGVEQGVQTGQQQSADNHGDEDLDTGVHITLGLMVGDSDCDTGTGILK